MKRVLLLILCVAMLLSVTACKKKDSVGSYVPTTTTTGEATDPSYALDPVINRFFVEFIAKYGKENLNVQSIRRAPGSASTKPEDLTKEYLANIDGLDVSVRNASRKTEDGQDLYLLRISIEGGTTVASRTKMLRIFSLIARVVDPGCTTDMADKAVAEIEKRTETISADEFFKVSDYINVIHYSPLVESVGVSTRIEIQVMNYLPPADKK